MYKQKHEFGKFFLILSFLSAGFVACKHDDVVNTDSPSYHISQSENLVIPAAIDLPVNPNGNTRVATFFAVGVQKYKAQQVAGSNPATFEWVFVAPQADLYDATNAKVATHSAGPTWQLAGTTTDSLYGQAFTPARTAPSPDANSIDWLLLMPKTGKTPTGIFANVAYIQRVATSGGKAPAILPTTADQTADVNYTAVYRFTKINP
jgi:Protein of unknown function (DUF3455)